MSVLIAWVCAAVAAAALVALRLSSRRAAALRRRLDSEIEARCAAEQRHAECERRFETVFDSLPECMKLHDEDGLIRTMNPVGLAMVDADSPTQVVGESVYRFIAPEYQDRYRALTAAVFRGQACSMEFRLLGLKGSERSIETHVVPARDHRGQVVAAMALTRDVTKVQDAEDRARRHLSELARMARIASMGEMASGIAHELNQPLTAIATYAGAGLRKLESSGDGSPEAIALLTDISAQARRAGQIIRNIRGLVSRSEPSTTAVDVNDVVRTVVGLVEPEAKQHGIVVRTDLDAAAALVCARRIEIEQVLFNLLRNAIEAISESGGAERHVTVSTRRLDRKQVDVSVSDSGPGITAPDLARVFGPFYTTKADGMGMGLSISRSIIEAHHSQLSVQPNPDRGVTFRFTLPTARVSALRVAA
jgi:two-component system sensor kinase FixL